MAPLHLLTVVVAKMDLNGPILYTMVRPNKETFKILQIETNKGILFVVGMIRSGQLDSYWMGPVRSILATTKC